MLSPQDIFKITEGLSNTQIKKYSEIYNLLQDLNEFDLSGVIEDKLKEMGYKVFVVGKKYKFKWVGGV